MSIHREFQVLSPISGEEDVFNHLIQVVDTSGIEGSLLCSRRCEWPAELFQRATWLEGCYTPEAVKDDPRLALGFHPYTETRWRYSSGILRLSTQTIEKKIAVIVRTANGRGAYLQGVVLAGASLRGIDFGAADLRGADLSGADLKGANLSGAYLQGANLQGANLQKVEFLGVHLQGADLRGANVQGAKLLIARLQNADLRGADFRGADLRMAKLEGADLREANLQGART